MLRLQLAVVVVTLAGRSRSRWCRRATLLVERRRAGRWPWRRAWSVAPDVLSALAAPDPSAPAAAVTPRADNRARHWAVDFVTSLTPPGRR
ncbi:hypothetical protein [Nonomuraea dietziae]|uniref:hypothetical protein n=1 Tax=Nonomuraea dietziae TaxID=65515 RepID=UPI0031DE09BD